MSICSEHVLLDPTNVLVENAVEIFGHPNFGLLFSTVEPLESGGNPTTRGNSKSVHKEDTMGR